MFKVISEKFRAWEEAAKRNNEFPHLKFGGMLIAIILSGHFAEIFAQSLYVILLFGPNAYFADGVRVYKDHVFASSGVEVNEVNRFIHWLILMLLWFAMIGGSELSAGILKELLVRCPRWITVVARLLGGSALLWLAIFFWQTAPLLHPIPLSAFVGGSVLVWRATASLFRSTS